MRIEGDRVGLLDADDPKSVFGGDSEKRTDAAVDMEPEVFFRRQSTQGGQVVDRTCIDGSGACDHTGRVKSARAVLRDRRAQGADIYAQSAVACNPAQRAIAQTERLHGLLMATMKLVRAIEAQGSFNGGDAVFPDV